MSISVKGIIHVEHILIGVRECENVYVGALLFPSSPSSPSLLLSHHTMLTLYLCVCVCVCVCAGVCVHVSG